MPSRGGVDLLRGNCIRRSGLGFRRSGHGLPSKGEEAPYCCEREEAAYCCVGEGDEMRRCDGGWWMDEMNMIGGEGRVISVGLEIGI